MWKSRSFGGSVVEMAFVAPLVAFVSLLFLNLVCVALDQIRLERVAAQLSREIACRRIADSATLESWARSWLAGRSLSNITPLIVLHAVPVVPGNFPRSNNPLIVFDIDLKKEPCQPFHFSGVGFTQISTHAKEVRL